jgi:hypothetical protein
MIRPVTLVTMMMAALSGAYLFGVKHRAQVLDDQLAAVTQESRLDDQRIAVLQAQWSLEIDHNRLQALTAQFSGLQAMKPSQLVTLAGLARALPPAGSAAPEENPAAPAVAVPAVAAAGPAVPLAAPDAAPVEMADAAPDAENALPLPPPVAPVMAQAAVPAAVQTPARVILASSKVTAARKRVARVVARLAARKSPFDGTELAENLPVARPVAIAPAMPVGGRLMAVNATAEEDSGQGGSMLGMAADLAPPQPLSPGTSN